MAARGGANEADAEAGTVTDANGRLPDAAASADDNDAELAAMPIENENPEADAAATAQPSPFQTQLYTVAYLIVFSFPGALARVGLQALTDYPGAPVAAVSSLWPNLGGCLVMGFLVEDRVLFRPAGGGGGGGGGGRKQEEASTAQQKKKKAIPLYIGLSTGFCGSFTTFSAFARDMFLALANSAGPSHPHRSGGASFMALLAVVLLTVGLSLGGFVAGGHLAELFACAMPNTLPWQRCRPRWLPSRRRRRRTADRLAVALAFSLWLGAVLLVALPPDRHRGNTWRGKITFTLVFSPPGTLLRYGLARWLNAGRTGFPLGTFAANILGTLLVALFWDLAHAPRGGVVGCQVLQGLQDGFCGCLTTVSTWAAELAALAALHRRRDAYVYGAASVLGTLGLVVVVMGSLRWTDGFAPLQCAT